MTTPSQATLAVDSEDNCDNQMGLYTEERDPDGSRWARDCARGESPGAQPVEAYSDTLSDEPTPKRAKRDPMLATFRMSLLDILYEHDRVLADRKFLEATAWRHFLYPIVAVVNMKSTNTDDINAVITMCVTHHSRALEHVSEWNDCCTALRHVLQKCL